MADATKGLTKYTPLMLPLSVRPYCRNSYTPFTTCGVSRTKTMAAISRIRTDQEVARRPVNKQCMNDINSIHLLIESNSPPPAANEFIGGYRQICCLLVLFAFLLFVWLCLVLGVAGRRPVVFKHYVWFFFFWCCVWSFVCFV